MWLLLICLASLVQSQATSHLDESTIEDLVAAVPGMFQMPNGLRTVRRTVSLPSSTSLTSPGFFSFIPFAVHNGQTSLKPWMFVTETQKIRPDRKGRGFFLSP